LKSTQPPFYLQLSSDQKSLPAVVSRAMALFRRLTSFSKSKRPGENGKANGINGVNTSASTTAQPRTATKSNATNGYAPAAVQHEEPAEDVHAATPADVTSAFEQYAQLIHASLRPLPNQSGDGSYLDKEEPSGFWNDMRSIGIKDLQTVKHMMVRSLFVLYWRVWFCEMVQNILSRA
jgi:linoleate 10R-lipoxygenase